MNNYTVQKGDSLWSIANKFGTTAKKLKEINKLSTNVLKVGQVLNINDIDEFVPDEYLIYTIQNEANHNSLIQEELHIIKRIHLFEKIEINNGVN